MLIGALAEVKGAVEKFEGRPRDGDLLGRLRMR
jgi:hypothetical protein